MQWVIAIVIGVVIWRVSVAIIRMLATPPPEIDPSDIVDTEQPYRCTICGTEVTMTVANVEQQAPPRHCREDMDPVI
ncbi:MAG: hypothetical protein OEM97_03365 [Acidimicrobiia bacterium]|nr:hypothetical protein [Acidimicrobiia bacterium]